MTIQQLKGLISNASVMLNGMVTEQKITVTEKEKLLDTVVSEILKNDSLDRG